MDGRVNGAVLTGIPMGIIQPFRTLGGKFDLGGHFTDLFQDWVRRTLSAGGDCLVFVTYHWSVGATHRGCKGFGYDKEAAKEYTSRTCNLLHEMYDVYGGSVYPIQLGIETDGDAFTLHGTNNNESLDLSTITSSGEGMLREKLIALYPDMSRGMMDTLVMLCMGNIQHIIDVKSRLPEDMDHMEDTLGFGRGFDWIHEHNKILIVGPYSWDLAEPIIIAGKLLLDNLHRRTDDGGGALMTSALYTQGDLTPNGIREAHLSRVRAELKSRSLLKFAKKTLQEHVPELFPQLELCAGVVCEETLLFTQIEL
jgi:hypothetical protein